MRVTILGEAGHGLAEDLAERLRGAGVTVVAGDIGADHRPGDEDLGEAIAASDAMVDFCVIDRARKAAALRMADEFLPAGRPLWTCCHATSATFVAASTGSPDRVFGFAFIPPWKGRTSIECSLPYGQSEKPPAAVTAIWSLLQLEPVWVGDTTGLVLPRMIACLANEAAFAVMEGLASASDVDRAMRLGTRYPRGPLAWANVIGLPAVVATMDALAAEHGEDRYRTAPLLRRLAITNGEWDL